MSPNLQLLTARASVLDFQLVETGIRARILVSNSRSAAFVAYVAEMIFGIASDDVPQHIADGGNDRGIDIVYVDHQARQINICSCKCVTHYGKSAHNFPGNEVDKIVSFVDDILHRREELLFEVNGHLSALIRQIWDILSDDPYDIAVHLFSNQLTLADAERNRLIRSLSRHRIKLNEHGLYELAHGVVRAAKPKFRKKLSPIVGSAFTVSDNGHRGLLTRITLSEFFKFVTHEKKRLDERLFAENVRYFLGMSNEVNREIRETLLSGNTHDFWFLNNGVTVVCDQIVSVGNGYHAVTLVNPQIVNGGQTAAVIFNVGFETLASLEGGSLSIKIIQTSNPEFIRRIALASNTQSRILGRDLRANDHIQTRLGETISGLGFFYRRKRGDRRPQRFGTEIDALRAGQLMLAYVVGEPTKSKTDSNEIFGELYQIAFDPNLVSAELIVAAHLCHEIIDQERRTALAYQKSISRNSFKETWIIEGHFHVLFIVGELIKRRRAELTDVQLGISLIAEAIDIVSKFVEAHPKESSYRLFRLASSKERLLAALDVIQTPSLATPVQMSFEYAELGAQA